ncbi:hypothetical protein AB7C87_07550 [Natrarchaeobius sp. A-rgal3]|uniref:hypothetical protein n=1 Tax=Natrarchaeobius versutus TaxID=1679078 RepID=UPI00350F8836
MYLLDGHAEWTWGDPTSVSEPAGYQYTFDLLVYDDEGVSHVELRQSGVREFDEPYPDEPREVDETVEFYGGGEEMLSLFRGSQTTVTAENALGDGHTEVVDSRHSVVGRTAGSALYSSQRGLGQWSGVGHGLAELPDFARLLYGEPIETLLALTKFLIEVMDAQPATIQEDGEFDPDDIDPDEVEFPGVVVDDDLEEGHHGDFEAPLWWDLAKAMGADIHRTQDRDNPHESPAESATETIAHCNQEYYDPDQLSSEYCLFAAGWYEGYSAFIVAELALGSKGTTKVADGASNANDLRRVLDETEDVADTAAVRNLENPNSKTGKINYRAQIDSGEPNIDGPAVQRHLREDHGLETAGSQYHAIGQIEDLRHLEDLSSSEQAALAARLSKSQDPSATRAFVSELDDVDDVRYLLEETDVATTNRLVDWHANPSASRNIDPDLEANDLVYVSSQSDVSEIKVIVKGEDGSANQVVRWLEEGDSSFGRVHISERHITGNSIADDDITSLFPVGKSVEGRELPNTLTAKQVEDLVYDTIKHGKHSGGSGNRQEYMLQPINEGHPDSGISQMRVVVKENGAVKTAFPEEGSAVAKWHPDHGWLQ